MKNHLFASLTATAAAATAMLSVSAPAQAFTFGNGGIKFANDTLVNFTFNQSFGSFQSTLKVFEVAGTKVSEAKNGALFTETMRSDKGSTDWKGTFGKAATYGDATKVASTPATVSFKFLANKVYTLGLVSLGWSGNAPTVYSTNSLNPWGGSQQTVFGSQGGVEGKKLNGYEKLTSANPFAGPVALSFEDTIGGASDKDFNDFSVTAKAEEVPEPFTMGGIALGAGGLMAARRRKNRKNA
jgi:hypothetical protein